MIDAGFAGEIAAWQGDQRLDIALGRWEERAVDVRVADEAVGLDVDTADDYQLLVEHLADADSPAADAGLDRLTDALDAVQASAANVLDLHLEVLAGLCEVASLRQADRYVGAGQRALIALLGALVQRARPRARGEMSRAL